MHELVLRLPESLVEAVSEALVDELDALSVSVADADAGIQGQFADLCVEIRQLARRPQPLELAAFQQGDPGRIIAAVFQTLQRLHQARGRRLVAEDSDNAAHVAKLSERIKGGDLRGRGA